MITRHAELPAFLEQRLAARGVEVTASLIPSGDRNLDDEIVFATPAGDRYPVAVQVGQGLSYMAVARYKLDEAGQVVAAKLGISYGSFDGVDAIVPELASALHAATPFVAAPPPAGPGR